MDPAETETKVEDTKHSLFREERGVWGREGGKLVKNDEQVIPRHPRTSKEWVQISAERKPGCIRCHQSITY